MFVNDATGRQIGVAICGPYAVEGLGDNAMAYVVIEETPAEWSTLPLSGGPLPTLQNAVAIAIRLLQLLMKKHPGPWYEADGHEINPLWPDRFGPESAPKA